jgi:hypothetical protein
MKDGQSWILYIASPESMEQALETKEDVNHYVNKVQSEQKEICHTCKHIMDDIFSRKLEATFEYSKACYGILKVPYISKEDKKKKGKK